MTNRDEEFKKLQADMVIGVPAIAELLGLPDRKVRQMKEGGSLPYRKIAGLGIVSRKSQLLELFNIDNPEDISHV